ncbi:hypothetical protein MEQU1_001155 [Malassezia equina]|uniref:50S ribosomal protein L35 n=1 Tax=Malassezia equina TaxID=1381935 RepID=A0AAF0EB63_9BASI|nr:hypothetical protein MEQU1_001155 [Malassezia equina]
MLGLGAWRPSLAAAWRTATAQPLHTSSVAWIAPRPSGPKLKLKSHSGAKKRFFPVMGASSPKFKRASTNKQHLNSGMSRVRLARLRGQQVVATGPVSKMLRRLLAPRL